MSERTLFPFIHSLTLFFDRVLVLIQDKKFAKWVSVYANDGEKSKKKISRRHSRN